MWLSAKAAKGLVAIFESFHGAGEQQIPFDFAQGRLSAAAPLRNDIALFC
jgi:hypothetical protein